jgi:hypothetical protein
VTLARAFPPLRWLTALEQIRTYVVDPSARVVSLPLLYPQNVVAWSHIRGAAADMGRSYYYRIQVGGQRGRARLPSFPNPPSPLATTPVRHLPGYSASLPCRWRSRCC